MTLSLRSGSIVATTRSRSGEAEDGLSGERPLIEGVPATLGEERDPLGRGLFLTATAAETSSRHWFSLGRVPDLDRFTVCHRYEPYWMKPRAGTRLSEVPAETQVLLARLHRGGWLLVVPLIGDLFRFSLRGSKDDALELLGETGDAFAFGRGGLAAFVAAGADPYELVAEAARSVAARLGARLRKDKALPDFIDSFGWCTWDAFYQEVSHDKVREGLAAFAAGGVRPRMLILDDGWQSTERRPTGEHRLTSFSANAKFGGDLGATVQMAKGDFGVRTFLVWHSIAGYWGGVDGDRLPGYEVTDQPRQFGEGILAHVPSFNQDWWGNLVGFVAPRRAAAFFDDYHRTLRASGVDGVKVDSQAVIEALSLGQGGRLSVARAYRAGLEASVVRHFDGRLINCMSNGQETWYGSPHSALLRSSIDFFPSRPETHGAHLYANAQVGLWFGEFMHPDWDMFQSSHEWGAYHAAARALSGGPVYVSDKPGHHDFALLRKLVCSDGSVLRCDEPARPTLDTLCVDPTREATPLKMWTRSGKTAVLGAFHALGAPSGERPPAVTASVGPEDIPGIGAGPFAVYAHNAGSLEVIERGARRSVSLGERQFEIFSFVPVERDFAVIGLSDKFASAAAVESARWIDENTWEGTLRDGGELLAWSKRRPAGVEVDGGEADFAYEAGRLTVRLSEGGRRGVRVRF